MVQPSDIWYTAKEEMERRTAMRPNRISFEDLVDRNKQQLLKDEDALEKIENKIDEKHAKRLEKKTYVN